ncbi:MAG: lamin tail domain-containing protein [Myxococcales bacterium]|nr:lamin tail domain-containing protein [Myxococcales bacterium]
MLPSADQRISVHAAALVATLLLTVCGDDGAGPGDSSTSAPVPTAGEPASSSSTTDPTPTTGTPTTSHASTGSDSDSVSGTTGDSTTTTTTSSSSSTGEPVDPCTPTPCLDPPPATCNGTVVMGSEPEGVCSVEADQPVCDYAPTATDCAAREPIAACIAGACAPPVKPEVGAVIFVELMIDPVGLSDFDAEWVELKNVGEQPVDINGCRLVDLVVNQNDHLIDVGGPLILAPGALMVLAKKIDPQVNGNIPGVADEFGEDFSLTNTGDTAILRCGDQDIDTVKFAPDTWPYDVGVGMALNPTAESAADNDDPKAWCAATNKYFGMNTGTPGLANPPCR